MQARIHYTMLKNYSAQLNKAWSLSGIILLLVLTMEGTVFAQGIERESLAGPQAVEDLHAQNGQNQPYNLAIGPVTLRADAGGSISYNDNIGLAKNGRQDDFIIAPFATISGLWQISDLNALTLNVGISYDHYLDHSANDSFSVSPNSETHLNLFVGDFKINIHDRFSYQNDPVQVGQLSNTSQFDRFSNDAGLTVDWDLGDLVATLGYDHNNFWVFESQFNYLDSQSDIVTPQVTFKLSKTLQTGLTASFNDTRYSSNTNIQNDNTEIRVGPFVTTQLSNNFSLNAQAGYDYADYNTGGLNGDASGVNSFYASAGFNHRINDVLTEALTAGREYLPGITSNYTQRTYANYTPTWQATPTFSVSPQIWWENLDDSNATIRENSNRYGANLGLAYAVTQHATLSLSYNFVLKSSDVSSLDYYQNVVTLGFNYQF